jgi:hypothetical protein
LLAGGCVRSPKIARQSNAAFYSHEADGMGLQRVADEPVETSGKIPVAVYRDPASSQSRLPAERRVVVEAAVARVFGVEHDELCRATRGRAPVALARQVAMYLAHVACGMSLTEVGHLFRRDRTTVAHACAVVEDRRDDPIFDRVLELLEWAVPSMLFPRASFATLSN